MRNLLIRGIILPVFLCSLISGRAQHSPFDVIYCLNGGENKSVGLPSVILPNPVEKPGWNLIFSDEFPGNSLDPVKWNKSNPIDDGNGSCTRRFAVNPANISVSNGNVVISNTAVELIPGCPFSSGEIKSMSVRDTSFRSYYFYASGFLEARVKLFSKQGQGASMWLWGIGDPLNPGGQGPWNEIDVFELNGTNANIADGTYHWTWDNKHTSQVQSVYLTDSAGIYDLSANWTTFGLEWSPDTIRWYINNVLVKELDLHKVPPFCLGAARYSQPLAPFCLRFGTGPNTVGNMIALANAADLPQSMLIDYVRVYKKQEEKATPILTTDGIAQLCIDTLNPLAAEKILWTPYYPEVTYEWSAPWFDLISLSTTIPHPPGRMLIRTKPGITPNQFYPVYLKATFPGNRTEFDTLMIYLPASPPPLPQNNFGVAQIDTLCYFEIRKPSPSSLTRAEYSTGGGVVWLPARRIQTTEGALFCFDTVRPEISRNFLWREWNGCGVSPEIQAAVTTPAPLAECKWPAGINESSQNSDAGSSPVISVAPCPVIDKLTINLGPSPTGNAQSALLNIFDLTGKLVVSKLLAPGINTLDLSFMKPGMFFIRVVSDTGVLFHHKWIRQ